MLKSAFENKWLDWHYDYDDVPTQASGPADPELIALSHFLFGASAPAGFRIFQIGSQKGSAYRTQQRLETDLSSNKTQKLRRERPKDILYLCSKCKKFFPSSLQRGIFVCSICRSKWSKAELSAMYAEEATNRNKILHRCSNSKCQKLFMDSPQSGAFLCQTCRNLSVT